MINSKQGISASDPIWGSVLLLQGCLFSSFPSFLTNILWVLYRCRSNDPLPQLAKALGIQMSNHDVSPKVKYWEHDSLKKKYIAGIFKSLWTPSNPNPKKKTKKNHPTEETHQTHHQYSIRTIQQNPQKKSRKSHIKTEVPDTVPFSCSPGRWSPNSDEAFVPPFRLRKFLRSWWNGKCAIF